MNCAAWWKNGKSVTIPTMNLNRRFMVRANHFRTVPAKAKTERQRIILRRNDSVKACSVRNRIRIGHERSAYERLRGQIAQEKPGIACYICLELHGVRQIGLSNELQTQRTQ